MCLGWQSLADQMKTGAAHLVLGKPMQPEVTDRLARLLAAACAVET